jgi:TRAP-type C4-dicarboxylate transport system substrate-binding protein
LGQLPAFVFMNKAAYAALPAKAKAALEKYSGEAFSRTLGEASQAADSDESKKVAAEPGQTVAQLSPAQRKIWDARLEPLIAAWVKRTPQGPTVLAAYRAEIAKASAVH